MFQQLAFLSKYIVPAEVVISVILSFLILIQNKDAGLGSAFGGGEGFHATRRGAEKLIFNATIVFAVLFVLVALLIVFVK